MSCIAVKPEEIPLKCNFQTNEKGDLEKWGTNIGFRSFFLQFPLFTATQKAAWAVFSWISSDI